MKKALLIFIAALFAIFAFTACNASNPTPETEETSMESRVQGGDIDLSFCSHPKEISALRLHTIPGTFMDYVGDVEYPRFVDNYASAEKPEDFSVISFFRFYQLSRNEALSLLYGYNDLKLRMGEPIAYQEKDIEYYIKEVYGSDDIKEYQKVDVFFQSENNLTQGLIYGTKTTIGNSKNKELAYYSLPAPLVRYIGIRNYNAWAIKLKDTDQYTIQRFLKDFKVSAEIYDLMIKGALEYCEAGSESIYTEEVYNTVRKEVYGQTKDYPSVPKKPVSSETPSLPWNTPEEKASY